MLMTTTTTLLVMSWKSITIKVTNMLMPVLMKMELINCTVTTTTETPINLFSPMTMSQF